MARILITGATGFLGAHLFTRLRDGGHDVYGTTRSTPGGSILYCNIEDDLGVSALFHTVKPEIVIHCAAISSVTAAPSYDYYLSNTIGTENVVKCAAAMGERVRVIFVSTAGVYGNQGTDLLNEDLCPKPVHHYGMSKFCCERLLANYADSLDYSIVRPFNIIGEGQNSEFIVPKLINAFAHREPLIRLGNMDVYRDYIDLSDAGDIIEFIAFNSLAAGQTYNLCSGRPVSLKELIQSLETITGHEIEIQVAPEFVRKNEVWRLLGDPAKLEALMGHKLQPIPIETSLRRMLAYKEGQL